MRGVTNTFAQQPRSSSHVVKVVGLEVILKAAVTGPGREQQMHTIPQKMEGGGNEGEVGQDAGVVAERGLHERGD